MCVCFSIVIDVCLSLFLSLSVCVLCYGVGERTRKNLYLYITQQNQHAYLSINAKTQCILPTYCFGQGWTYTVQAHPCTTHTEEIQRPEDFS